MEIKFVEIWSIIFFLKSAFLHVLRTVFGYKV